MKAIIFNPSKSLTNILRPLYSDFYFTTISKGYFRLLSSNGSSVFCLRLPCNKFVSYLIVHFGYLISIFRVGKSVETIIISQLSDYPLLSMFVGKLMGKKIIDFIGGSRVDLSYYVLQSKTSITRKMASVYGIISLNVACRMVNKIVLISDNLRSHYPYKKFKNKLEVGLNFPADNFHNEFKLRKKYAQRSVDIGYIGAFTRAKGVYDLALGIQTPILQRKQLKMLFVGDWQNSEPATLGLQIKKLFENNGNVKFVGSVNHEKVADYLNEIKLLVLSSYSEGVPHIILESMACGTPVLATPVGGIPGIISDGVNGFLVKSNDPKEIARKITELLEDSDLLEKVSANCCKMMQNFSREKTTRDWQRIISNK